LETCSDLVKQDANGATALLGGLETSIPDDAKWARDLTDALSNAGEDEIRAAKNLDSNLGDLAALFPSGGEGLLSVSDEAAIREALASDNIQVHLPGLRAATRATLDRVKSRYADHRRTYSVALESILKEFETMPEWARIAPEDREELAGRVTARGLPDVSQAGREVADLRLLLAREAAIGSLKVEVEGEIQRRLPPTPAPAKPVEAPTEEIIAFADLLIPEVIRTDDDLESWLSSLRSQLHELLKSNRFIRIEKRSE
jgi:hypothetical protein